jgi:hypothetical protein
MKYQEIIFEEKGSVAYLTLNRPDIRNAITGEIIIKEIEEACKRVQENNDIGVMIVTGAGSAFSAGGNVKDMYHKQGMFSGNPEQLRKNYRKGIQRIPLALYYQCHLFSDIRSKGFSQLHAELIKGIYIPYKGFENRSNRSYPKYRLRGTPPTAEVTLYLFTADHSGKLLFQPPGIRKLEQKFNGLLIQPLT